MGQEFLIPSSSSELELVSARGFFFFGGDLAMIAKGKEKFKFKFAWVTKPLAIFFFFFEEGNAPNRKNISNELL